LKEFNWFLESLSLVVHRRHGRRTLSALAVCHQPQKETQWPKQQTMPPHLGGFAHQCLSWTNTNSHYLNLGKFSGK